MVAIVLRIIHQNYYELRFFGQHLPDCEYKGNKSKIQKLIRKIHIDANGSVTDISFK